MNAYFVSVVRTAAPALVGAAFSFLSSVSWLHGVMGSLPENSEAAATVGVAFVFMLAYYAGVRWLEARYPKLGVLLGVPVKPKYGDAAGLFDADDVPAGV